MPCSRVTINGVDYINLENDTVASSNDIVAGKYGHLNTGERVLGTGQIGGSGVSRTIIAAQQTVTVSENFTALSASEGLTEGNVYVYTVDDTEYVGTALDENGMLYVRDVTTYAIGDYGGNLYLVTQSTGQHTVKVEELDLSGGGGEPSGLTYETYFDSSITVSSNEIIIPSLASLVFAEDERWRVTWDGDEYICNTTNHEGWLWYIGNIKLPQGSDDGTGEPFCLYNIGGNALNGDSRTDGTHTLKLEKQTSSGDSTPSATSHTILFEFTDTTNATITAYYDSSFISNAITATVPSTYNNKTVASASLDGVAWYELTNIPLNTELIDFSKCTANTSIGDSGEEYEQEWYYVSDFTSVDSSMTFTYVTGTWTYIGLYDRNKTFVRISDVSSNGTVDQNNSNLSSGTLNGTNLPSNVAYVRLSSVGANSNYMSLIRTA